MSKKDLFVSKIEHQLNILLINDKQDSLNSKRNCLYTKVKKEDKLSLLSYLKKNNFYFEAHINDFYWIYL